jgi:hypothetical protein
MPRVGFEPTIPVFERAKTVHAVDCAATVIGFQSSLVVTNNFAEESRSSDTDGTSACLKILLLWYV